nr:Chain C, Mucin-1 subunit alpha [Homo sapiens]7V64_C Chain C, Mucin-1 subunit alpha [Homo sapiens]7V7K_C Chain C, Mucin-1 subunit alpha [Homo sapiens]7V8Q_G Chain G, Mucin-1 subunit alpha [Homo sapiens]7V8Q_H Chain H, Mucin-1 subunit alpha [Homo sapiens]7V8Q_I Chain I, Mucin-1 subunit alpha [Homo sapiens]7VAC_G Chain G, Mucin-1 subunit alpha [Homo sapiens]7VAC_H Chain H, Mucin-1 subunit alpha [Homo sapiens]7VAC_I Chain I, Mucin-1 subunit alpha [Homo sapiens]7VAZ_E Chain E, Mucin-1 subuni
RPAPGSTAPPAHG